MKERVQIAVQIIWKSRKITFHICSPKQHACETKSTPCDS